MEVRIRVLKNKRGVSAVIGVILVVAITVLLAALAYTYLTSMATPTQNIHKVALEVQRAGPIVYATITGGQDVGKISTIKIIAQGVSYSNASVSNYATILNNSVNVIESTLGINYTVIHYTTNNTYYINIVNQGRYNLTAYLKSQQIKNNPGVGDTIWILAGDVNHPVHVKVIATFSDGTSAVLYEGTV